ncbi:hypothetical protein HF086_001704 [Spodoptera exigua]|uniref:Uncharacterized protein n=1 Tax=Spodoptera exigua TaxID=7107 RepID=A0A922SJ38_SPOEX|nr:hypothetical protein HF086_001704 [Spodoptera exigua]
MIFLIHYRSVMSRRGSGSGGASGGAAGGGGAVGAWCVDEKVLPRRFARALLHAAYTDSVSIAGARLGARGARGAWTRKCCRAGSRAHYCTLPILIVRVLRGRGWGRGGRVCEYCGGAAGGAGGAWCVDEKVLPRRFARALLHAAYTDSESIAGRGWGAGARGAWTRKCCRAGSRAHYCTLPILICEYCGGAAGGAGGAWCVDEKVLPRRFARALLHAAYTDSVSIAGARLGARGARGAWTRKCCRAGSRAHYCTLPILIVILCLSTGGPVPHRAQFQLPILHE